MSASAKDEWVRRMQAELHLSRTAYQPLPHRRAGAISGPTNAGGTPYQPLSEAPPSLSGAESPRQPSSTAYDSLREPGDKGGYAPMPVDGGTPYQPLSDTPPSLAGAESPRQPSSTAYGLLREPGDKGGYAPMPVDGGTPYQQLSDAPPSLSGAESPSQPSSTAYGPLRKPGDKSGYTPMPVDNGGSRSRPRQVDKIGGPATRRKHPTVNPVVSATGLSAKRVEPKYEGEHNRLAWREWGNLSPDDPRVTTRLYTDQETAAGRLVQDERGAFAKADGTSVEGQKLDYVLDPDTGAMVAFTPSAAVVRTARDGTTTRTTAESSLEAYRTLMREPSVRVETTHHSSALGGEEVRREDGTVELRSKPAAAAGEVEFDAAGHLIRITNASGHYKPTVGYLIQAVELLARQGAFLTDEVVDAQGQKLAEGGKLEQLYQAVQRKRANLKGLAAQIATETEALATARSEKVRARSAKEIERLTAEVEAINAGINVLRSLGVGPSQKTRPEARVGLIEGIESKTGAQVHDAEVSDFGVDEFLRTGAGNAEQAQQKSRMHQELLAKRPAAPAAAESEGHPSHDESEIAAVLQALSGGVRTPHSNASAPAEPLRKRRAKAVAYPTPPFESTDGGAGLPPTASVRQGIGQSEGPEEQPVVPPAGHRGRGRRFVQFHKRLAQRATDKVKSVGKGPGRGGHEPDGAPRQRSRKKKA